MWATLYGIDGLRWDATVYVRTYRGIGRPTDPTDDLPEGWSLCQWLNNELRAYKDDFITLAEDFRNNPWIVKQTEDGGAGFSAQWDGAFCQPVRTLLQAVVDSDRNLNQVVEALCNHFGNDDKFNRVIFSESHDEVANGKTRVPSQIDPGTSDSFVARKRSTLGAILVLTAPGVPMLFQGQEFLEDGWFRDKDPLDWDKLDTHRGIQKMYHDLIRLRRNMDGLSLGLMEQALEVNHVNHKQKVLAYRRWSGNDTQQQQQGNVLVALNFSAHHIKDYEIGVPIGGEWFVRFNSDGESYSADFSDEGGILKTEARPFSLDGYCERIKIELAPYSGIILSQQPQVYENE